MDFDDRKAAVMAALSSSAADKSPKGSLDVPIAPLVAALNRRPSLFTTSSCSGRVTILSHTNTHTKKKAGGGTWLLASHDPVDPDSVAALLFDRASPPVGSHVFRFEPLIIAAECRNAVEAQWLVTKAIACGMRESGITNLGKRIMVALRCSIRMEVPLGDDGKIMVSPKYVRYLAGIANEKMEANRQRTEGFYQMLLQEELGIDKPVMTNLENNTKCREHSVYRKPRQEDMLFMPSLIVNGCKNGNDTALVDGLDEHDAESVIALSKDDQLLVVPSNSVTQELMNECKDKENKEEEHQSGFTKEEFHRLSAIKVEITGQPVERVFLWGHSTCVSDKMDGTCIIIFGGFGGVGRHARRNDILVFEQQCGLLRAIDTKGPPSPRLGHTSSTIGDQVFIIGGRCGPTEILDDVWLLNMVDFRWTLLECTGSILHPRHRHAAAVVGTCIYVFGGLSKDVIHSSMHVLDAKTLHWSEVSGKGEWPCARHSHSMVAYGSQLYLFGGYDGERALGDLYSFNVETLTWKKEKHAGRAPFPRFSHCSFVYKNFLGIVGGCPLMQEHQEIVLFDLTNHVWKQIKVDSVDKGLWIRSSANIVADELVVLGGGAACYAFGTKFNHPMKISLLAMGEENYHCGNEDCLRRLSNGTSNGKGGWATGFVNTECTGMEKSSPHNLAEISWSGYNADPDKIAVEKRSLVEAELSMLQVEKNYAKLGKDILKQFGWLDLGRKVVSNEDGSQICFPVTNAFSVKWTLCSVNTFEERRVDHLLESCQSTGFKVNEISLPEALNLLFAFHGSLINDDKPKIKKSSRAPRKILHDAVSSLIADRGLPQKLLQQLPTSWDHLGDIVVLPVASFRNPMWDTIAGELWPTVAKSLNAHRLARQGRVSPTGTRDSTLEILVGDNGWVTHQENGIIYSFDATKCMFSAGNVSEKLRMARLNCSNEVVVDLFTGIGYFVLPFILKAKAKLVYACEWNPHALEALRHNIQVNDVANRCVVLEGDNCITAPKQVADRVCLGLLPSSERSWATAVRALRNEGGILHIHGNVNDSEELAWSEHVVKSIDSIAKLEGCHWNVSIQHLERVKWYGPHIRHLVADARVVFATLILLVVYMSKDCFLKSLKLGNGRS